ncbi:MFS transporter [Mariniblastus fucicola]|uniref:Regulatory protein UhpC n=1 Tax=Mariniblastus fucicola TaxID=980251 RepID=A0A5B9P8B5_9BACT|nr:MFS transporter [Mariniblastus fucicola]QEG20856.1 regulatory protein UhpC [Mariniblastus fucicola]
MLDFIRHNARWLLGAFLLTLFSGFGQTFFISLFSEDIRSSYDLSDGQFGLLYMGATLCSAVMFLNVGFVADRFPIAAVSTVVLAALALACGTMAVSSSVWLLGVCLFCLRLFGQGMMLHVSQTAVGRWFDAERGRALSLTSMGLNLGESTLPTLVGVATLWVSWRYCWAAAAMFALLSIPFCFWLTRIPREPTVSTSKKPQAAIGKHWTRSEVIRDKLFWFACPGMFAPAFIITAVYFNHQHLVGIKGWPEGSFGPGFMVVSVTMVLSKLYAGSLIDRYGAIGLMWIYHLPLGLACLLLALGQSVVFVYLSMTLIGIGMGFASSMTGTVWPELYGTKHLGSILSLVVSGIVFSSACGSGLTGVLLDAGIGFESQLAFLAAFSLLSAVMMFVVSGRMRQRLLSTVENSPAE